MYLLHRFLKEFSIQNNFLKSYFVQRVSNSKMSVGLRHIPSRSGSNPRTSIWTEFINLAIENKAVNLGQGFSDSPMPSTLTDHLKDIASYPQRTDLHQYTRGYGHLRLVNVLGKFYSHLLKHKIDPLKNILNTVGAYLGLYYSFIGWLNEGDEVIIFEPAYDSYVEQIKFAGGVPVPVVLQLKSKSEIMSSGDFYLDLDEVRRKITLKTKMIVINNPNNPTGKVFTKDELEGLAKIAGEFDLIVVSDEVYEFHCFPNHEMIRFASLPGMYDRTITIGSAGKCFSATGWKLGWVIGPEWILQPLKKIHEQCVFTIPTPLQEAIARQFEVELEYYESENKEILSKSYLFNGFEKQVLPKRDLLANALRDAGFNPIIPDAGYFMLADFSHLDGSFKNDEPASDSLDYKFVRWLCREKKLAAIPPSAFYSIENRKGNDHFIRFCYYKKNETLNAAIEILKNFSK